MILATGLGTDFPEASRSLGPTDLIDFTAEQEAEIDLERSSLQAAYPYHAALTLHLEQLPIEYLTLGGPLNTPLALLHLPPTVEMVWLEESDWSFGANLLRALDQVRAAPRPGCRLTLCTLEGDWDSPAEYQEFASLAKAKGFEVDVHERFYCSGTGVKGERRLV